MPAPVDDPVLRSARREALVVFVTWIAAMTYSVAYCYLNGYNRDASTLTFVLGFPDWIFYGLVAPWTLCVAFSYFFGAKFMHDEHLGEELEESPDDLGI